MRLEELANLVNGLISERTRYGVREEVAEKAGYEMMWSNGSASWFVGYPAKKGQVLQLDANEVFVSGAAKRDLERLIEDGAIMDLPLFGGSFERRMAGTPDYTGVELPPMVKAVRDVGWVREEAVEEALRRKAEES